MDPDSDSCSGYDSDEEFILRQYRDFLPKYDAFLEQREVWRRRIPEFQAMSMPSRGALFVGGGGSGFEALLIGLHYRPQGMPFMSSVGKRSRDARMTVWSFVTL